MCQQLRGLSDLFRFASPTLEQETLEGIKARRWGGTKHVYVRSGARWLKYLLTKRLLLQIPGFQR